MLTTESDLSEILILPLHVRACNKVEISYVFSSWDVKISCVPNTFVIENINLAKSDTNRKSNCKFMRPLKSDASRSTSTDCGRLDFE